MASGLYRSTRPLYLSGGHPAVAPPRDRSSGNPDHLCPDRFVLRERADLARPTPYADTPGSVLAGSLPRRHQPPLASNAALDPLPHGSLDRLDRASAGRYAGLAVPGRHGGGGEGVRQAAFVVRMELLFRQEAQGLRAAHRGADLVQCPMDTGGCR